MARPKSKAKHRRVGRPLFTSEEAEKSIKAELQDDSWKEVFLNELRKMPIITTACRKAKVGRRRAYRHRDYDEEFGAAWDDALEEGYEVLMEIMMDKAHGGDMKTAMDLMKMYRNGSRKDDGKTNITLSWEGKRTGGK